MYFTHHFERILRLFLLDSDASTTGGRLPNLPWLSRLYSSTSGLCVKTSALWCPGGHHACADRGRQRHSGAAILIGMTLYPVLYIHGPHFLSDRQTIYSSRTWNSFGHSSRVQKYLKDGIKNKYNQIKVNINSKYKQINKRKDIQYITRF